MLLYSASVTLLSHIVFFTEVDRSSLFMCARFVYRLRFYLPILLIEVGRHMQTWFYRARIKQKTKAVLALSF